MTITVAPMRNEYTATAGQTVFTYTFKIFEDTDLNVYVTPAGQTANDATDQVTPTLVTGVGNEAGGTVTIAATSEGDLVTIVGDIPASRTTDYQNNGDFRPNVVNNDFDRVVSLVKQGEDLSNRSLVFQESQQGTQQLTLPAPQAGFLMRWNSGLTGLENVEVATPVETTLNSVAALRNLPIADLAEGTAIFLNGYYTAGDGGGGPRRILLKSGGPYVDNGGSIIVPSGGDGSAAWLIPLINEYYATWFGAVNNPAIDSTNAIQNAINYVSSISTWASVHLPFGNYRISAPLLITKNNFTLTGAGFNSTIITRVGDFGDTILVRNETEGEIISFIDIRNIGFSNNAAAQTTGSEIRMVDAVSFTLSNIRTTGAATNQITLQSCIRGVIDKVHATVTGTATSSKTGLLLTSSDAGGECANIRVDNCMFASEWVTGTSVMNDGILIDACDGIMISNTRIGGANRSNLRIDNRISGVFLAHVLVSNCFFDLTPALSIVITGSTSAIMENISIIGCSITGGSESNFGVSIGGNAKDIRLIGNRVNDWTSGGVEITDSAQRITIGSNFITRFNSSAGANEGITTSATWTGTDLRICDNDIDGNSESNTQGIHLRAGQEIIVTGNRVRNCDYGVLVALGVIQFILKDNILLANSIQNLGDSSGAVNKIVSDNLI